MCTPLCFQIGQGSYGAQCANAMWDTGNPRARRSCRAYNVSTYGGALARLSNTRARRGAEELQGTEGAVSWQGVAAASHRGPFIDCTLPLLAPSMHACAVGFAALQHNAHSPACSRCTGSSAEAKEFENEFGRCLAVCTQGSQRACGQLVNTGEVTLTQMALPVLVFVTHTELTGHVQI